VIRRAAGALMLRRTRAEMGQTRQRGVLRWGPKNAFAGQSARCQTVPAPVQHKEKGQALIELALVLPIILVFLMVIIDFGLALDHREVLQQRE